jgi:division protein CdvB (Snf7/Vps24/ESCRT-III family)
MKEVQVKLGTAIYSLDVQRRKLEGSKLNLKKRDELYQERLRSSLKNHDKDRAIIFANEIAEIRKALKSITYAELALEQIALRLQTVREIGDVASNLAPAISVIKSVRENLFQLLPQADTQFQEISDLLGSILVEAVQSGGYILDFSTANSEAETILKDAEAKVKAEVEAEFPTTLSLEDDMLEA